ncbi:hypothetical protein Pint_12925 [Pistacia integerrima]|uniref:Uncharacterized protein n=1 Tax=Pistacia integerrima TaxID=434235 RepID=A0ACC0Y402_9ROSI|nr:hypothetical protein Pint_12925 [Pistacia integerrima]
MPRKSKSAKVLEKTQEIAPVEDEKPSSKSKKGSKEIDEKPSSKSKKVSHEIDEIFAGKKRKKPEEKKSQKSNKDESGETKLVKKKKENKSKGVAEGGFADAPSRPKRKTEDGFTIYTEEELRINNSDAGNTPLCPFDCSCCF